MKNPVHLRTLAVSVAVLSCLAKELIGQEYPPSSTTGQVVNNSSFELSYSEPHEQAEWVYYYLSPDRISGSQSRTDNFREDGSISTGSATLSDYKGSGYDRGHLCPAGDNTHSKEAMSKSFLMSNISPQDAGFNRGAWKRLETQFRAWSASYNGIYVVTGGVLSDNLSTIGGNRVSVPKYFYKIGYDSKDQKMIAFMMPNSSSKGALSEYSTSVDNLENLTGIDFFLL